MGSIPCGCNSMSTLFPNKIYLYLSISLNILYLRLRFGWANAITDYLRLKIRVMYVGNY